VSWNALCTIRNGSRQRRIPGRDCSEKLANYFSPFNRLGQEAGSVAGTATAWS